MTENLAAPFTQIPASPFTRLRHLLADLPAPATPINLAVGDPCHAAPDFVLDILADSRADYGDYPPISGLPEWRTACANWLTRRFGLPENMFPHAAQILPVNGTREALFLIAQLAPRSKGKTHIAMPNPFYQVYAASALAAGATPLYMNATKQTNFLPDPSALTPDQLHSLRAMFICTPAMPQGAVADKNYLHALLDLARKYKFWLITDECYADIYDRPLEKAPPISALNAAAERPEGAENLIAFHSLSKRSGLPGLRSGFCVGGEKLMASFFRLRMIVAPQTPIPAQKAAAAAWGDDAHAQAGRALYQEKMDMAEEVLSGHFEFYRPAGGFFLWLNVGDGEKAAYALWQKGGIRTLPGGYLAHDTQGGNPAQAYMRVALVDEVEKTRTALTQMRDIILQEGYAS